MDDRVKNSSFVIVGHSVYPARAGDLRRYLLENGAAQLAYINHDFSTLKTRRSHLQLYRRGRLEAKRSSPDYRFLPEPLVNIKDIIYTLWWMIFVVKRADVYIGLSGFDTACGVILKSLHRIRTLVYYSIDFMPVRFTNRFLNEVYHRVNEFALKRSTEIWDLSPRMAEGRRDVRGLRAGDLPPQYLVPSGIWPDSLRCPFDEVSRSELVFIGELSEKTGVQLVLEAMPEILAEIPSFVFRVIGTGPYEIQLKALAARLGIEPHVVFEGLLLDETAVAEKLAHAAAGVALYDKSKDDFTYYADPGKLKTYLSAGLPILLTDLPWNARELEAAGCAVVVEYDKSSVAKSVIEMLKDEDRLIARRESVEAYAMNLDWNRMLDECMDRLL